MPRYEYECLACGSGAEHDQTVARRQEGPACPRCGASMALRLSAPLVVFKGPGWTTPTTVEKLRARNAGRDQDGSPKRAHQ